MSFDPNQNPPVGHATPKSGSNKKWIFAGLGCFGLVTLLCIGGFVAMTFWAMGTIKNEAYETARTTIETDDSVAQAVGPPVRVGDFDGFNQAQKGQGVLEYSYDLPVEGSEKSGRAKVVVSGNPIEGSWQVDSIEVEVDGEKITVGELNLELDIEE